MFSCQVISKEQKIHFLMTYHHSCFNNFVIKIGLCGGAWSIQVVKKVLNHV